MHHPVSLLLRFTPADEKTMRTSFLLNQMNLSAALKFIYGAFSNTMLNALYAPKVKPLVIFVLQQLTNYTAYSDDSPDSMNYEFPRKALSQWPLQVTENIAMISALLLSETPTLL